MTIPPLSFIKGMLPSEFRLPLRHGTSRIPVSEPLIRPANHPVTKSDCNPNINSGYPVGKCALGSISKIYEDAALYVEQVLPLHEETGLEMEVWLAFVVKSLSDPSLSELRNQLDNELRQMFRILIRALMDSGATRNDHDEDIEVERIYDLVDGLAIHAIQRPELMPPEKVKAVLRHHLSSL